MFTIDTYVLYVEDIQVSQGFYTKVLGCESRTLSPTCMEIKFANDTTLLLKQNSNLVPTSCITGGGTELSILVEDQTKLESLYQNWKNQSVDFAQEPKELSYGVSFVALDPDEHRIRVTIAMGLSA
ncbi:VOC family protein [Vibrio aquimaris]|uniref:Glyoxalase-like domain protein n=1 Tax=Vibrio aquimaris TaxID=2587862 RepID=A0A5P9CQJ4_9VIBR|nr:VOC family protein [Vibrio aquimaris]QFT28484.1 Glyoxalase-like domain protein [Vibrio aquimaris]